VKDAIRKNLRLFLLVLVFVSLGLSVGAYILANQRLRFPLLEEEPLSLRMELPTAQAVTPGQGQTVRVSGVQIGEIGEVDLEEGRAVVELLIQPEYEDLVREDATALMRPKTSLKDMFMEVDPGKGRPLRAGGRIPLRNTLPDVNPDEFLAMLDADTRDYLRLLINGAGRGLAGRGGDLREVFRLFEPTHRDLARVQTTVATRRANLRRLVHSLRLLSAELAGKEDDLAELVDAAAVVFRAYASEDRNISATVRELPSALRRTTRTLGKVERFARVLGPASENLRPAARALGRSQVALRPFARDAAPLLEERIRPLVREARPLVRDLRPAARDLASSTPDLTRTFKVLNSFFNMASFNQNGREGPEVGASRHEGYLFWIAWVAHQSAQLFSTADAHGPFRPSLVAGSCQTFRSIVADNPALEFQMNLTPIISNPALCGE
jgi:phospholipid/cholesterol/gamma-HCH transport system substrate-binding protein